MPRFAAGKRQQGGDEEEQRGLDTLSVASS